MKKTRSKNLEEKYIFCIAFAVTLSLLILIIGCLLVDRQGRMMSFNDKTPVFSLAKHVDGSASLIFCAFGNKYHIPFTAIYNFWEFFKEFCCLPYKLLL